MQLAIGLIMPMCRSSGGAAEVQLSPCDVHAIANLLVKIFGRARVGLAPASSAVVMGEVGCVPLGRWQHTRRVAHASDECAIEREARIVFRICNVFVRGVEVEPTGTHTSHETRDTKTNRRV